MIKHKHHIIPKHRGGSDDISNLVEITPTCHMMFHWCEYQRLGLKGDLYAYRLMRYGGNPAGWNKGIELNQEHKEKISQKLKGHTPWNKGIPMKESSRELCKKSKLGKSNKNIGNNSWSNRRRVKPAVVINTKNGVEYYGYISDIARALNLNNTHLNAVASGHRKIHKGYIAKYI